MKRQAEAWDEDAPERAARATQGTWIRTCQAYAPSLKTAALVFAVNRVVLIVISWLAGRLFYDVPGPDYSLAGIWERWDVKWYVQVADHGYHWLAPPAQSDVAFFPLYPLLMHVLTLVSPLSAYIAGLLITNVCFFAALLLLHRLVLHDFDPETAERAVIFLGLFPTALFFFTAYSEALYLTCCLGCVYALRLRRWWLAGCCGAAAALTRQVGVLLVVPFVVEYLESTAWRRRPLRPELLAGALIPAGALAFMLYLQIALGNGLLFLQAQTGWGRSVAAPWQGIVLDIEHILRIGGSFSRHTSTALQTIALLDLCFAILFLVLLALGVRRLPRAYSIYAAVLWLAILMNPATGDQQPLALLSISRLGLTIFPPFIVLGLLGRHRVLDRTLTTLFVALLALFTIIFIRGRWIA